MADASGAEELAALKSRCEKAGLSWTPDDLRSAGIPIADVARVIKAYQGVQEYIKIGHAGKRWMLHKFELRYLWQLAQGEYDEVEILAGASKDNLLRRLPEGLVDILLGCQDRVKAALPEQQVPDTAVPAPQGAKKRKRVMVTGKPSDYGSVKKAAVYFPKPRLSDASGFLAQSKACFITGRPLSVPLHGALSAALLAPEFGLVLDAFWKDFGTPTSYYYEAAIKLLSLMAKVYDYESTRQAAFIEWHNQTYPGLAIKLREPSSASTPSSASEEPHTDGTCPVPLADNLHAIILEAKNELGKAGDPHTEGLRYYQIVVGDGKFTTEYLDGMGYPAYLIALNGPYLGFSALYRTDSNQVVLEPLTPLIPLIFDPCRQPAAVASLARVLMAVGVGGWGLVQRLLRLSSSSAPTTGTGAWPHSYEQQRILDNDAWNLGYSNDPQLRKWFQHVQTAAGNVSALCAQRNEFGSLVPYPLWGTDYRNVTLFKPNGVRLMFSATRSSSQGDEDVLLKITGGMYPKEVHEAWSAVEAVPRLIECHRLPGGSSCIVMERLGEEWKPIGEYRAEEQVLAKEAAREVLIGAHKVPVTVGSSSGFAVHGDVRGPNVLARREKVGWAIKIVDLDWAGLDGVARYPSQLNTRFRWHRDAGQGRVITQEHDLYTLGEI